MVAVGVEEGSKHVDHTELTHQVCLQFTRGIVTHENYLALSKLLEQSSAIPFDLKIIYGQENFPSLSNMVAVRFTGAQTVVIRVLPENVDALELIIKYWLSQVLPAQGRLDVVAADVGKEAKENDL